MGTTGVVTILFTDLVGSTDLLARLGEERAEQLRQTHFSLLREAIGRTQGTEVKNLGDGLMVAFAAASDAVGCAVGMQQALERHNRRAAEALDPPRRPRGPRDPRKRPGSDRPAAVPALGVDEPPPHPGAPSSDAASTSQCSATWPGCPHRR
jgi:hypothetical protein